MKSDFLIALTQLASERHLPREQVLGAIEAALASAFKKDSPAVGQSISVRLNPNDGEINVYATRTVVDEVEDDSREMLLKDAQKIKATAAVGEEIALEALPHQLSRIAAQTAKQVVLQRLREVERERVFQEFVQHIDDVISGVVDQMEPGRVLILDMGRAQATLLPEEQVSTERYKKGQRLKLYVLDVRRTAKGPEILVSRRHKNLLKRLFEIEVPEVFNGIVEIKSISRESGSRSKVSVASRQDGVDPVGSCIGMRGNRIQSIVNELQGEKIDVVRWDKDPKVLISNALSPSEVVHVDLNEDDASAFVVVPERQLSLAIGKEGQNARLAAKLTGYRLDIKSMSEWEEIRTQRQADQEEARRTGTKGAVAVAEPEAKEVVSEVEALSVEAETLVEPALAEVVEAVADGEATVIEEVLAEAEPVPEQIVEPVVEEVATEKLSPEEELALLTLAEEAEAVEEEEEELVEEEVWQIPTPVLPTGSDQIRFAEDILGDFRGTGRRSRKGGGRRGGGYQGGAHARKGGGPASRPRPPAQTPSSSTPSST